MKALKYLSMFTLVTMMCLVTVGCTKENEPIVEKTDLQAVLDSANYILSVSTQGNEPGQYPETAMTDFTTAISIATAVFADTESSQEEVDAAVTTLGVAITTFTNAVIPEPTIDKSALQAAINAATTTINEAVVGNLKGQYLLSIKTTFQTAIDSAQSVFDNENATQVDIDQAVTDLNTTRTTFLASANENDIDNTLSLYLPFSGSATDVSPYKHVVELKIGETNQPAPSLTSDRFGVNNMAYKFEGGFMSIANDETLNPNVMSVMFWMKMPALSPSDVCPISLNWWDCYMAKIIGGAVQNEIAFVAGGVSVQSGVFVTPGQWYHVAISRSTTELAIYVDGVLKNTQAATSGMNRAEGQPLRIGILSENGGYYYPYFGDMDEIRIYSRALTAGQVEAIYNNEKP